MLRYAHVITNKFFFEGASFWSCALVPPGLVFLWASLALCIVLGAFVLLVWRGFPPLFQKQKKNITKLTSYIAYSVAVGLFRNHNWNFLDWGIFSIAKEHIFGTTRKIRSYQDNPKRQPAELLLSPHQQIWYANYLYTMLWCALASNFAKENELISYPMSLFWSFWLAGNVAQRWAKVHF